MAFAFGPIEDTREANVPDPRELLTATWCPAFAKSFAAVPPMCPAPTIPIRIPSSPERACEDVRDLWIFGFRITFALSTGNYKPRPQMPRNPLERTHDGDARAPLARATQPLRLLCGPTQGPMDCLFERVWRGWVRLPHRLHHGVLPGDRGLVASRRPPPRRGRRRD